MKISEWLNLLPDGYKERAIRNFEENKKTRSGDDREASSLSSAINGAFSWASTPEGHEFWSRVRNETAKLCFDLPPLPEEGAMGIRHSLRSFADRLMLLAEEMKKEFS